MAEAAAQGRLGLGPLSSTPLTVLFLALALLFPLAAAQFGTGSIR